MEFATFGANGMTCGVCVTSVSKTLRALPGVSDVPVSLADHRIDLKFDERRASVDAMAIPRMPRATRWQEQPPDRTRRRVAVALEAVVASMAMKEAGDQRAWCIARCAIPRYPIMAMRSAQLRR